MLYIFVLELENDKWFLHLSYEENYKQVELECQALYSFVRKNPPLKKVEVIKIFNKFEINTLTKRYMEYYGIDNVRGGIYSDEILPDYLKKSLELELSTTFDNYTDKTDIFCIIRNKPNLTLKDFDEEISAYNKLVHVGYKKLDRSFIHDLIWLENKILSFEPTSCPIYKINREDNKKYKKILEKMNIIKEKYFNLADYQIKLESTALLNFPSFTFDFFMYHQNIKRDWEKDKEIAMDILKKYELMGYTLINILDCMIFDFNNRKSPDCHDIYYE
jgi:hypothetical protein